MSDDNDSTSAPAPEAAAAEGSDASREPGAREGGGGGDGGGESASDSAPPKARVDADGLPLDREATLDDVRETHGVHGRYALGCTILIVATIVAFWLIRGGLGG